MARQDKDTVEMLLAVLLTCEILLRIRIRRSIPVGNVSEWGFGSGSRYFKVFPLISFSMIISSFHR